jgi:soluble lytic murein transglycosylase-like protein
VAKVCALLGCVALLLVPVAGASGPAAPVAGAVVPSATGMRQLVHDVSREHGLDPKLVDAVVRVESNYNPQAVSRKGAMGLMQLMPATATRLGVEDPFDPEDNVRGGVREFARLVDRYRGNLQLALAAYNAGEGAVERYRGIPPYAETRDYVARILGLYTGKPYRASGSYRAVPVRLTTDPATGRALITNQPSGSTAPAIGLSRTAGGTGPLAGGFGSSPR